MIDRMLYWRLIRDGLDPTARRSSINLEVIKLRYSQYGYKQIAMLAMLQGMRFDNNITINIHIVLLTRVSDYKTPLS